MIDLARKDDVRLPARENSNSIPLMFPSAPPPARGGATARLRFEPLAKEHITPLVEPLLDPAVYGWIDPHRDEASFRAFCEAVIAGPGTRFPDQTWWNHAIFDRATGTGIGRLESTFIGQQVEIAYLLGSSWWHRGLGSEALIWLLEEIQQCCPTAEVWATVHPDNTASQRLLERNGLVRTTEFPTTLRSYDPGDLVFAYPLAPSPNV